ncbi:MAG TPA: biosynthetic peptidoglycan transglycosylase, partial [Polyangiaceae bacterium]
SFGARRRRLRRQGLAALVAFAALAFLALLIAPLAGSVAKARARSRGVEMDVKRTSLGWGRVRLSGVTIRVPELPGVEISFDRVEVSPTLFLGVRRVEVRGGCVRIVGAYDTLRKDFTAFKEAHAAFRSSDRSDARDDAVAALAVEGVDLTWHRGAVSNDSLYAWGLRYERAKDDKETLAVDLGRLAAVGATLEVSHGRVDLTRDGGERVLAQSTAERLTTGLDLDRLLEDDSDLGSNVPARGTPLGHPLANPLTRPASMAAGAADSTDPLRGPKLRERIRQAAAALSTMLPPAGKVDLPPARFEVRHGKETLNFGPATAFVAREAERVRVSLTSGAGEGRAPLALGIVAPTGGSGALEVELSGGPLPLAALGVREGDMGLQDLDRAEIEINGRARLAEDGRSMSLSGQSRISDLSIQEPRLAPDPVRGLRVSLGGELQVLLDGTHAVSDGIEIGLGKVKVLARGSLDREGGHAKTTLHVEVPLAACSDMLAATPPALVPRLSGLEVSGTFALNGDVSFDTRRPADVKVDFTAANACRLTKVPAELSPEKFRRPWTRTVLGADHAPVELESGPGTPGWVPLFDVSPYVTTSVVVCEDAHFYTHDGFDGKSLEDSIRDDLRAGKFVRGGSTVSMQLAKNRYLGREKTLSRKLEEAVLTLLLEQTLGKAGILELYLNVVELAPGIYGIGPAAWHYFHTTPKELSLAQSLYLVSLLPNPKAHHFEKDGTLRPNWAEYLRHLMGIAHKIHRITDAELAAGLAETVQFGVPAAGGSRSAPGDDSAGSNDGSANSDVLDMAPRDDSNDARGP